MRFRPCIDIHNGRVKQIVGGSLTDSGEGTAENFVSDRDAAYYAGIYRDMGLTGGHIAMLNAAGTPEYEVTKAQAIAALSVYPDGLQVGGGINAGNAHEFIEAGASHVIVTSYIFRDGRLDTGRLDELRKAVGREHIVLDLSSRFKDNDYRIVTDRWQTFTELKLEKPVFDFLSEYCDEFLVHAVDVEGKRSGIDGAVLEILAGVPYTITYAGGVADLKDVEYIKEKGGGHVDVTIGSALSLFGGSMELREVIRCIQ